MYKIEINNSSYEVGLLEQVSNTYVSTINGQKRVLNVVSVENQQQHVLCDNSAYKIAIKEQKDDTLLVAVNDYNYTAYLKKSTSSVLNLKQDEAGDQLKFIKSFMSGKVVGLFVKEGDCVKKGDVLMSVEAMKMENVLKCSGDGMIKKISVQLNDVINKNDILIEFE